MPEGKNQNFETRRFNDLLIKNNYILSSNIDNINHAVTPLNPFRQKKEFMNGPVNPNSPAHEL